MPRARPVCLSASSSSSCHDEGGCEQPQYQGPVQQARERDGKRTVKLGKGGWVGTGRGGGAEGEGHSENLNICRDGCDFF